MLNFREIALITSGACQGSLFLITGAEVNGFVNGMRIKESDKGTSYSAYVSVPASMLVPTGESFTGDLDLLPRH